ncbi:Phosphoinositide phosphatase SAC7 [Vitis vinifera]|uniref:Phosphoinositide phosphatase SAC7 n=1 Tax=Vitis vinifera TaxID=29760 RepID=A0A438DBQ7_VITVI|nr:Phosphoinositide phosphatase SAC7 [Vitis vinifera]
MMAKADSEQKLYTRMRLWEFPDQYIVEPTNGSSGSCLAISREDGSMKLIDELQQSNSVQFVHVHELISLHSCMLLGSYLLVITERECVGSYLGHPIFKVSSLKVLPCDHSLKNSTAEQKKMEGEFSGLINVAERASGLFFSYDTNLTLSVSLEIDQNQNQSLKALSQLFGVWFMDQIMIHQGEEPDHSSDASWCWDRSFPITSW